MKPPRFTPARPYHAYHAWPAPPVWARPPASRTVADEFLRGAITTGMLAALQGQGAGTFNTRRTARLAVQGGAALAAGVAAVQAARQAQAARALLAVAAGAAAVAAAEHWLGDDTPPAASDALNPADFP